MDVHDDKSSPSESNGDDSDGHHRQSLAPFIGAGVGLGSALTVYALNLDHVTNLSESIRNAEVEPYLRNDQSYVAKINQYNLAMDAYKENLRNATTTSQLEAELQAIQDNQDLPSSTKQVASNGESIASSLKHPVSNETYQATKSLVTESVAQAQNKHSRALVDSIEADDATETTVLGSAGYTAIIAPLLIGGYVGNKLHQWYNSK
jgi:hypothetical protein